MTRGKSSIQNIKSHLARREWQKVIDICQQKIDHNPHAVDFYPYLARAYTQQGKLDEAINAYHRILETALDRAEVYAELGVLYSKKKNPELAIWNYEQALNFKPNWAELKYNLGVVLHQSGNWRRAISVYNKAIEIKPDYAAAYFNLGVIYDRQGELEAAIASYQKVIAIQPDFIRAYSNLGSTFSRQNKFDWAIAIFKQGLALDPTWATLHNNLGQVYLFNQQEGLAYESFKAAISLNPHMPLAHHNLGKLWQKKSNLDAAIKCYRRVIELEPDNLLAYSHCAEALLLQGNLEAAMECWQTVIKLKPEFVDAYCHRILEIEPEDLLEIAKVSCARFLHALKNNQKADAYHHLWRTYYHMGDVLFDFQGTYQAEIYYQRALQIQPQEVELYFKLGNCLARLNKLDSAVAVYQIGLNLEPEHPQICFQLGKILERQQYAEQAIDYYEAVLNQDIKGAPDWENLPRLFPAADNYGALPSKIYHHTQDWVRDCNLDSFEYVEIVWGDPRSPARIAGKRNPETIPPPIHGQPLHPDCGGVNCSSCMDKLIEHFEPLQIGKNAYKCTFERANAEPIQAKLPFVVNIPQGRSWIAAQKNSWIICNAIAVITGDNYLLGDLSRDYPWFLPGCPYQERPEHKIFELDTMPPLEKIDGKVALLSGLAGHVYYHWMIDVLPRINLLQRSGINLNEIDWFVVNSLSKPFQRETLKLLGIPEAKIIESDRHGHIQARELIVPSFPGYLDWVPPGTIKFLRQTFMSQVNLNNTGIGNKIYISRAKSRNRQLVNELEVSELLYSQGFQTIFLEEMTVLEQVAVFSNANVIVASHGSGLTNLVFCSPETKIIELFSPNYLRTDYWMISQQLKLEHYYVVGENFDSAFLRNLMYQNSLTEDILVNIDSLKLILNYIQ